MENLVFTQLSVPEIRQMLRQELERFFSENEKRTVQNVDAAPRQFLSIDEACSLLHLAKPTIYGLVSAGKIPYMKQGKKLYFSQQELTEWIKAGHSSGAEELTATIDQAIVNGKKNRGRNGKGK